MRFWALSKKSLKFSQAKDVSLNSSKEHTRPNLDPKFG